MDEARVRLNQLAGQVGTGSVLFLTGAGISAESGIPTFRGPEGYWRIGSTNYHPQELATNAAFRRMPDDIWAWYLYRHSICQAAEPNEAHHALVRLERALGDRFKLVTQNVDGLHLRAGNSPARTYQIHGDVQFMRCAKECRPDLVPLPDLGAWPKERRIGDNERAALRCPACGASSRPHVLWFDEYYDEERYRWESSVNTALAASIVVVIGTSGVTALPQRIVRIAVERGIPLIVINADPSPFAEMAEASPNGLVLSGRAGTYVPLVVDALV